jgi:hypothetical protein
MKTILSIKKPNGIFMIFNNYDKEDDFPSFLSFLTSHLGVKMPNIEQHPYSLTADIQMPDGILTAMFHDDTGCCVRLASNDETLANQIAIACYGETGTDLFP